MPGKRDLTLLFGVRLLSAMGVTLILPVMPAMARTFGLSIAEAAWWLSALRWRKPQ